MLLYIVSLVGNGAQMNIERMETAFDLLIESNDLTNAENLAGIHCSICGKPFDALSHGAGAMPLSYLFCLWAPN